MNGCGSGEGWRAPRAAAMQYPGIGSCLSFLEPSPGCRRGWSCVRRLLGLDDTVLVFYPRRLAQGGARAAVARH